MRLFIVTLCLVFTACANTPDEPEQIQSQTPVADEFLSQEYQETFADKVCGMRGDKSKWTAKMKQDCTDKANNAFVGQLFDYYKHATVDLRQKCTAYPIECHDLRKVEGFVRASHRQNVQAGREHQNNMQLQGLGQALQNSQPRQPTTTKCTSTQFGYQTQTECK